MLYILARVFDLSIQLFIAHNDEYHLEVCTHVEHVLLLVLYLYLFGSVLVICHVNISLGVMHEAGDVCSIWST